ncbi:MAG TPA: hypothetical protein DDW65_13960 [Firmicutes bacterium]|jgi:hypothetical protein|nr:hypothetical protein [Bacillota bacterium]
MTSGKTMSRALILLALLISMMLINVKAEDLSGQVSAAQFERSLKALGDKFGVVIIADPLLVGPAPKDIQGDTVEVSLKTLLDPLGYSYTKVDNYYLVSGPRSPLTLMAEADSTLVPVGFLDEPTRQELGEFKQYLTYDESLGVAYVKAPASQLNQILTKLWEKTKTSGQLSIAYSLQIMDVGSSSDLDFLFSATYDKSFTDNKEIIVTPEQWTINSQIQFTINQKADEYAASVTRQPWLITIPGKMVQLRSSTRSISGDIDTDRFFTIQITPLRVDAESGKVTSDIRIERDMTNNTDFNQDSDVKEVREQTHRVATMIHTTPGKREILAVIRHTNNSSTKKLGRFESEKGQGHRDFVVFLSATPVNIQTTLATSSGLVPIASLGGFEALMDEEKPEFQIEPTLELGISAARHDNELNGWFNLTAPIGSQSSFTLDYRNELLYSAGLSFELDSDHETSLEVLAGKGIGPDKHDALMIGIGDVTQPASNVNLFAKYFAASYIFNTDEYSKEGVWWAGARFGTGNFGLSLSALGDPDYEGWDMKMEFKAKKATWIFEVTTTEENPTLYLGVGFHL